MSQATCGSCGDDASDLVAVRRIYVTWADDGTPADQQVVDEVELWCAVCRSHYPHEIC